MAEKTALYYSYRQRLPGIELKGLWALSHELEILHQTSGVSEPSVSASEDYDRISLHRPPATNAIIGTLAGAASFVLAAAATVDISIVLLDRTGASLRGQRSPLVRRRPCLLCSPPLIIPNKLPDLLDKNLVFDNCLKTSTQKYDAACRSLDVRLKRDGLSCDACAVSRTSVLLFCFAAAKPRLSGSFAHGDSRILYHRYSCNTSLH